MRGLEGTFADSHQIASFATAMYDRNDPNRIYAALETLMRKTNPVVVYACGSGGLARGTQAAEEIDPDFSHVYVPIRGRYKPEELGYATPASPHLVLSAITNEEPDGTVPVHHVSGKFTRSDGLIVYTYAFHATELNTETAKALRKANRSPQGRSEALKTLLSEGVVTCDVDIASADEIIYHGPVLDLGIAPVLQSGGQLQLSVVLPTGDHTDIFPGDFASQKLGKFFQLKVTSPRGSSWHSDGETEAVNPTHSANVPLDPIETVEASVGTIFFRIPKEEVNE